MNLRLVLCALDRHTWTRWRKFSDGRSFRNCRRCRASQCARWK